MFRGEKAAELLGNEAFNEALDTLESEVVEAWVTCPARDSEAKEYYWQLMKNTRKFRGILRGYIEGGKAAALGKPDSSRPGVLSYFKRNS